MVPTFTWGLVLSYLALAISVNPSQIFAAVVFFGRAPVELYAPGELSLELLGNSPCLSPRPDKEKPSAQ